MDATYSGNTVDVYLLEINSIAVNVTETATDFSLPSNTTEVRVGLSAMNCFGVTPVTTFHFAWYQGMIMDLNTSLALQNRGV